MARHSPVRFRWTRTSLGLGPSFPLPFPVLLGACVEAATETRRHSEVVEEEEEEARRVLKWDSASDSALYQVLRRLNSI
jgi:hypothetical protein